MKSSFSQQISASPLVWISTALLGGILLANRLATSTLVWFQLALMGIVLGLVIWRLRPQLSFPLLLLPAFIFLGAARYQMVQPVITSESISYYNNLERRIYVTGIIAEPPDVRDTYINLRMRVIAVDLGSGDIQVNGDVLVSLSNEYDISYGDRARVRGFLRTPKQTSEFSYRDYLERQGIYSTLDTSMITILPGTETKPFWDLMYRLHGSLLKRIYQLFPEPEASLLAGILLGVDQNLPSELQQAFRNTGTSHIIAISGFNIAIIAGVFILLFSRVFGKKWGSILAILGIMVYTVLVGASASVVRAAIMGTLSVIGGLFGRRSLALNALAIAALVMAFLNPMVLWEIGFQLSFAATLGLVFYALPMQEAASAYLLRIYPSAYVEKYIGPFSSYFILTFAAQLTTLPVSIYHFGRISLVSFISNPVVLPAQPAVMVLGGLAVLLSKVYMPLGQAAAWIAWPFAAYTIRMVEFFDKFPGGVLVLGDFSLLAAVIFYVILFGFTLAWSRFKEIATPSIMVSALAVFAFLMWRTVVNLPDGRLHVLFLNVGSADGILITTPNGQYILINGGESPSMLADQLGPRIPPFSRGIDYLLVASTQENQVAALPRVLEQYRPKFVLWAGNEQASFSSRRLKDWLTTARIPIELAKANSRFDLGDGVTLHILAVSPRGAVASLEMGNFKAILPIGVNFDVINQLDKGKNLGPSTALLISESGYAPANPPTWLENLKPQLAIISVAADDPDGLPSSEVVSTIEKTNLMRTDQLGWIELATNGIQLWISSEHK